MSVNSYDSVNTFNDVTSSQFVQLFHVDYYDFRHVVNKANLIEVSDYPDKMSAPIQMPLQNQQKKYMNNYQNHIQFPTQQTFGDNNLQNESIEYFKQVPIPQQPQKDHQSINQLQQSQKQLNTYQKNISQTLNAIKDDQVFMGQYGQQLKDIQHKNEILCQQNKKLLQDLENVKTQLDHNQKQQIDFTKQSFIQDFDQYKQEIRKINNDLEDLKKSRKSQRDNIFLQSITSKKNIPSDQKKSQRDEQINYLLKKIEFLEQKVNQNPKDSHNCSNCKTCQQKDKTISYLKQFLDDSPIQNVSNLSNNTFKKQSINRQYTTQQKVPNYNQNIRHSYSQAKFTNSVQSKIQNDEYGSFKEGTTVVEQDGQRYPRGTSIRRYRNNQGNRVTEIRTPPKLASTYIDDSKRYNFQQKYPIYQGVNNYQQNKPIRYSINHNTNIQTEIHRSKPRVTYVKHDGSRSSYIRNSNVQNQSNTNNLINGSRRSSTFEDYYKTQNGIRTSQVIKQVTNSKENIQHDEYGINSQQNKKQSQQNLELFSVQDVQQNTKEDENLGMMSFGVNNFKQGNLNFHGSKNLIKAVNQNNTSNQNIINVQEDEDKQNQSDDIMNIIQTKTLNRSNQNSSDFISSFGSLNLRNELAKKTSMFRTDYNSIK